MELKDLEVYNEAKEIGQIVWDIVFKWDYFQKDTIGKQFVRAADSIAANISEGFGRFHFADAKKFYYYSRGSIFETITWSEKALERKLISPEEFEILNNKLNTLGRKLNNFIKKIGH